MNTYKFYFILRCKEGLNRLKSTPALLWIFIAEIIEIFILIISSGKSYDCSAFISTVVMFALTLFLLGIPVSSIKVNDALRRIAFDNGLSETPILLSVNIETHNKKIKVYRFYSVGLSLDEWEKNKSKIEATLNINIVDLDLENGKDIVVVRAVPASGALPAKINWDDSMLSADNFTVKFGKGLIGDIELNLAKIPHILIGGSTGSGKTILLKCILHQCLLKNAKVIIADFKGGVDFNENDWSSVESMCYDVVSLLQKLESLVEELERRKAVFRARGYANIDEFNSVESEKLQRYIFACDEIAEVLDTTGVSKEDKELIGKVTACLSTIARQGRAFGIHLIIATQRPDANIIPGQIKNNIDCRICGKADNVLSQIILDKAVASTIPKSSQGRFMLADETIFQAFYFSEKGGEHYEK